MDNEKALETWTTTPKGMMDYVMHCEIDTYFIAAIAMRVQILPLAKQLTNIAGNSWYDATRISLSANLQGHAP